MRFAFSREWMGRAWSKTVTAVAPPVETSPAPSPVSPSELGDIDLRVIWHALVRRRAWVIVPTGLALLLSLIAVNMITPRYKSEARILIDGRENVFLRPNGERSEERGTIDAEAVTSQGCRDG